jgi:hypothetical protein
MEDDQAMEEFDTSGIGVHPNWPDRFFAKIVDSFLAKTENNGSIVGNDFARKAKACLVHNRDEAHPGEVNQRSRVFENAAVASV